MNESLKQKLYDRTVPKRILSLDGGGVRGIMTLGILKKIETMVRAKEKKPDLVLGKYYDIIGGTSTGAIIASGLALGWEVDKIIKLYERLGSEIFGKGMTARWINRDNAFVRAFFRENYSSKNLETYLQKEFGDITIGDQEEITCGLVINTKRADTYSLWTILNHPDWLYYPPNKDLKLWELCRATSAAPYYFKPKKLRLKRRNGEEFDSAFIDGGVSLANNPAWQLFLVATVPSFGFQYEVGVENLHITSLGTGNGINKELPDKLVKTRALLWARKLSNLFMTDALEMNDIILNLLGQNRYPSQKINSQFFDLHKVNFKQPKLFSFERHNVKLDKEYLEDLLPANNGFSDKTINSLREMDHYENIPLLLQIGEAYAAKNINTIF